MLCNIEISVLWYVFLQYEERRLYFLETRGMQRIGEAVAKFYQNRKVDIVKKGQTKDNTRISNKSFRSHITKVD